MNEVTNTYHLELLRKINKFSKDYYGPETLRVSYEHDKYLADCNAALFEYFKNSLADRFVFSALSYITHTRFKAKITIVKGDDEGTDYNFNRNSIQAYDSLRRELKNTLERVLSGEIVSMTNILLNKDNTHDLYLVADECVYCKNVSGIAPNIIELPLQKINYFEDKRTFSEDLQNKKLIQNLFEKLKELSGYEDYMSDMLFGYIWHYKRISDTYIKYNSKPIFIHFIRPSIVDDKHGYNLLLSLATNSSLTESELTLIDLFVYRIVGQLFIERVKDEEHQNLLTLRSGIGHFLKNRVDSNLVSQIENANASNNSIIEKCCKKLKAQFESLFHIGSLFHMVSAVTKNNSKSILGTDLSIQKSWVQRETFKLSEIFTPLTQIQFKNKKYTESKIRIIDENSLVDKLELRPFLNNNLFLPVSWIYKEIFFELFFNACKYAKSETSSYDIEIEYEERTKMLLLTNTLKDDKIKDKDMFSGCIGRLGRIQNSTLTELSGLAFIDEFLIISKIGELYSSIDLSELRFTVGLKLEGLTKTA